MIFHGQRLWDCVWETQRFGACTFCLKLDSAKRMRTSDRKHRQYMARLVIKSRSCSLWVAPNHSESDHCASSKPSGISKSCAHHIPHSGRMTGATGATEKQVKWMAKWDVWANGAKWLGEEDRKLWGNAERALFWMKNQYPRQMCQHARTEHKVCSPVLTVMAIWCRDMLWHVVRLGWLISWMSCFVHRRRNHTLPVHSCRITSTGYWRLASWSPALHAWSFQIAPSGCKYQITHSEGEKNHLTLERFRAPHSAFTGLTSGSNARFQNYTPIQWHRRNLRLCL